jgi:hypothetical protein
MTQPPQADLSHLQATSLSSAASLEMTEGHHTLPSEVAELVEHNSWGRSGSVSPLLPPLSCNGASIQTPSPLPHHYTVDCPQSGHPLEAVALRTHPASGLYLACKRAHLFTQKPVTWRICPL